MNVHNDINSPSSPPVDRTTTHAGAIPGSGERWDSVSRASASVPSLAELARALLPMESLANSLTLPPLVDPDSLPLPPLVDPDPVLPEDNARPDILQSRGGRTSLRVESLLDLPAELLINILNRLDTDSDIQAFAGTCHQTRALYRSYLFPQQCLRLINKHELDEAEKEKLRQYYTLVLHWLFNEKTENLNALKSLTHVAEKFFKHFSISEISTILMEVLQNTVSDVAAGFERLAKINLVLTTSLIVALDEEHFEGLMKGKPLLLTRLSSVNEHVGTFLANMRREESSNSALHYALKEGYFDIVLALLSACPESVNMLDEEGASLLMVACSDLPKDNEAPLEEEAGEKIGELKSLSHLLEEIKEEIEKVNTIEKLVDLLIKSNEVNVNLQDKNGLTVLAQAIFDKKLNLIDSLLKRQDINVNIQDAEGDSALMYAIHQLQLEIVHKLLRKSAEVNAENAVRHTALLESILTDGNPELAVLIVEALLNNGADMHLQDEQGRTALMHAVLNGRVHIAKLLIERGANINHQDAQGMTPLMHAIVNPQSFNLATLLLKQGADIHLTDHQGRTAFDYLREKKHYSLAGWLTKYGNSLNLPLSILDEQSSTALMQAISQENVEIVRFLLSQEIKINYQDAQGITPLMYAVSLGRVEIVKLLIEWGGVKVNLQDKEGRTALYYAVCLEGENMQAIIELLLKNGADANLIDINGHSPSHIAFLFATLHPASHQALSALLDRFGGTL